MTPAADPGAYRDRLEEILSRPEFRSLPRAMGEGEAAEPGDPWDGVSIPEGLRDLLLRVGDWLGDLIEGWFSPGSSQADASKDWVGGAATPALWAMGIGAALLLLFLLWRLSRRRPAPPPAAAPVAPAAGMPDALSRPADAWERLAGDYVREGQWRLAIRSLYLALLVLLHQRGLIRYARESTNGDYVDALARHPARAPFAKLTGLFDQAWYGNKPFGEEGYQEALRQVRDVEGRLA